MEHPDRDLPDRLRAANGRGNAADGWNRSEFTNWMDEQRSWKETCYIGDWSFLANCRVTGPGAGELLRRLTVNDFEDFPVGRAKHAIQCDEDGHVVAEGVVMCSGDAAYVLHGVPCHWVGYHLETGDYDADIEWRDTFNFQVQGPDSLAVLESLTEGRLRDVEFVHFRDVDVEGVDVTAVRMGMSGELGFELQGPAERGDAVWDAVVEAGEEYGIRRLGSRTALINHVEACFPSRGRDYVPAIFGDDMRGFRRWLDERASRDLLTYAVEGSFDADDVRAWYRTPVELGWTRTLDLDHEFVGRRALEAEVADPRRTMVTLEWDAGDVVGVYGSLFDRGTPRKFMEMPRARKRTMQADRVTRDGGLVGVSTSRGYSYHFREMLSLCTVDVGLAEPGTTVTVHWGAGGRPESPTVEEHAPAEVRATVAPAPYKEDRRRADPA